MGVSILRAADCMLGVARSMMPSMAVGKVLIQRDESTAQATLIYSKLPPNLSNRPVLLLDPMLATGGQTPHPTPHPPPEPLHVTPRERHPEDPSDTPLTQTHTPLAAPSGTPL